MNTTDNPISNHASYVPAQVACSWQESQIYMLQSAFFYWGKTGFQESETRGWCLHTQLPNRILKTPDKITGYSRLDFTHVHFSLKVLKYAVLQFYFINFFQYLEIKALFPLLLLSILVFCLVAHFHKLHESPYVTWTELLIMLNESSREQVAAVVGRAEGNHADVSLPDSIKAFVFACHMRVPACVMTCTVAITTLKCRGFLNVVCFCTHTRVLWWLSGQLHKRTYLWLDLAKIHPFKSVFYSVSHKQMPAETIHFQTTR